MVDYKSYAVIGIRIHKEKLFKQIKKETVAIDGFDETNEELFGIRGVFGIDGVYWYFGELTGKSTGINGGADDSILNLDKVDIEDFKCYLRGKLEPRGLWDDSMFGLWAVLYAD